MSDPQRPYTNRPSPFPPPGSHRQARIHYSLSLLRSHPAVNSTGPHAAYRPPPTTCMPPSSSNSDQVPSTVIKALFNDLVRRELGVDPSKTPSSDTTARLETHLSRNRAVAPKPSLSSPAFVAQLANGHAPSTLTEPKLIAAVAPPTMPKIFSPSAAQIHRSIREAREQQAQLQKARRATKKSKEHAALKRQRSQLSLRRSTRKRTRSDAQLDKSPARASADPSTPPPKDTLESEGSNDPPTHSDIPRRTRSALRRLKRMSSNHTTSECCFCPDPELFDSEEINSELIGPFVNRKGQAKLYVHFDCACWAPQVFADSQSGQLRGVYDEYCRGRKLKCSDCGGRGATIGCYVQRCKHVFHFRCLPRSGARRVERFFVAFCANHAHLGEKKSYKILMEAATIADVAEAHRRQDTTFGLDAPHSRYTQLRRRETELIFSRKLGVCSHNGAFESNKVIFSHKRRKIIGKTDRLLLTEQPRALLVSAFDVASGRLAYMSVAGNDKVDDMTAVEARAALASREKSSLFLLRNLRHAPTWNKNNMAVVKNSGSDVVPPIEPASGKQSEEKSSAQSKFTEHAKVSVEVGPDENPNNDEAVQDLSQGKEVSESAAKSPGKRRPTLRTVAPFSPSEDEKPGIKEDDVEGSLQSAPLPVFKKSLRIAEGRSPSPAIQLNPPTASTHIEGSAKAGLPRESSQGAASPVKSTQKSTSESPSGDKKRKHGVLIPKNLKKDAGFVFNSRQGLAGKVKSAWETFLEEQLPKERILRPDDSEAVAMRNMARLWSLLSVEARESYEERARQAGLSRCDTVRENNEAENISPRPSKRQKVTTRVAKSLSGKGVMPISNDPGLFVSSDRVAYAPSNADEVVKEVKQTAGKRHISVYLPKRSWDKRPSAPGMELLAVEWDDVLPTSLGQDPANISTETERVRRPPPRKKM